MSMRQRATVHTEVIEMPEYSKRDLDEFGKWLNGFKKERRVRMYVSSRGILGELLLALMNDFGIERMETIHPIDMQEAMVAFGAMRRREYLGKPQYSVIVQVEEVNGHRRPVRPTKVDLFEHKYEAWARMNARRQYASAKELEELDQVYGQTALEHSVTYTPQEVELLAESKEREPEF